LTLLVPTAEDDEYELPILHAPFDGTPHAVGDWPIGQDLLNWYQEAKLVRRNDDGSWQSLPGALEPLDATTSTAQALNTFLANVQYVRASPYDLPPLEDGPLVQLPPEVLEQRIAEIQRELLIDRSTILRIYRSLVAGHHVILSARHRQDTSRAPAPAGVLARFHRDRAAQNADDAGAAAHGLTG
jgi:hypothetical protein